MARKHDDQSAIRRYLLGQLSDAEQQEIEQRLLSDEDLFEELEIVEDELIDEYLESTLSADDRLRFEEYFLASPERKQKLKSATALKRYFSRATPLSASGRGIFDRLWIWLQKSFFSSPIAVAATLLVVVGLGFFGWRAAFSKSDVDRGLIALNSAYREQRPLETRITQFSYAPFSVTRGGAPERIDSLERQRAERYLLDAVHDRPGPKSFHALGKFYLAGKDFDKAIGQFEQAAKGDPNNAQIHADLGAALLELGKLELEKGKSDPASSVAGTGMKDLGRSLENLDKALQLAPNLLEALFNRALCHRYLMLFEQAADDWQSYLKKDSTSPWAEEARKNLQLLEESKKKVYQIQERNFQELSDAYRTGDVESAWPPIIRSRSRFGNAIVTKLLDDYLNYTGSRRDDKAIEKLQLLTFLGTVEVEKSGDRFTQDLTRIYAASTSAQQSKLLRARQFLREGVDLYNHAEWTHAVELFSQARDAFMESGDEPESLFAESLGGYARLRIPDPEKATEVFRRLSHVFESREYRTLLAQSLLAEADASGARNEFSKVLEYANRSLAASEKTGDISGAVRGLQARTSMQLIFGNYDDSLAASFHALNVAGALPPDPKLTWPFYHEASLSFQLVGMPSVAAQFEGEALRLAIVGGLPLHTSRSYDRLALLFQQQHKYNEAVKNNALARAEGQKIPDEHTRTNIMAHSALSLGELYSEMGEPQRAISSYDEALQLYTNLNLDIYQYRARKGRLLALMAASDDAGAAAELPSVLYWFEQNRGKIAEEEYRNKFFDTDQSTYDIAVDFEYSRRGNVEKALDYAEASRARSLLDLMRKGDQSNADQNGIASAVAPLAYEQLQSKLPQETQLVEFAVLDDKVIIWVITKDQLRSASSPIGRNTLNEKIKTYLNGLVNANLARNDETDKLARDLYAILIAPVENYLDRKLQLCFIPDDKLSFLPFNALLSPNTGRYLLEDFRIQTAPSATTFVACSDQARRMEGVKLERILIVGNPDFDRTQFPNLPNLPGAEREASEVADIYAGAPLQGRAAFASIVKARLHVADVVHLATHAIPDEHSPLRSKLLFANDDVGALNTHQVSAGFISASEIYAMKFPKTRLVVLSACETGVERTYRGEGAIGLARPFIAGGVPLVVASLWSVESEAAANLMISFHKHRKRDRVSTAEALRRAQLDYLYTQPQNSSKDFGWAAFVAIGGYANF